MLVNPQLCYCLCFATSTVIFYVPLTVLIRFTSNLIIMHIIYDAITAGPVNDFGHSHIQETGYATSNFGLQDFCSLYFNHYTELTEYSYIQYIILQLFVSFAQCY